jgi:hypothetical protein
MADNVQTVYTATTSDAAASNGIVAKGPILVHKVALQNTNGSNAISALIYDAATATGTAKIGLTTEQAPTAAAFLMYRSEDFDPPVLFQTGLSTTLAGANVTLRIYYTR